MSAAATTTASSVARAVVKGSRSWPHSSPALIKFVDNASPISISPDHDLPMGSWSSDQIRDAVKDHVMVTWTPGKARLNTPIFRHGKGVYLFDDKGSKYLDWTSQAVCSNVGYDLPETVIDATMKQMKELPFIYGGLGITEIRARLSKLCGEILPGDLQGMVFPSSGSEANEAAIKLARRYTGKFKVFNWYRSYHGGTTNSLQATGDCRRWFNEESVTGFVKSPHPYSLFWDLAGATEEEKTQMALNMLEEQILNEGPDNVALLQFESIVGTGGVLVPPPGYMQGVRAICDKYDILMHCDEVMVGFGRTGNLFGFQHFDGVVPDIVTAAKGLSSAALPISMMATRQHIMDKFEDIPLGWGSTYQGHPVAMTCAYENIKFLLNKDVIGHVQEMSPKFEYAMKTVSEIHPSIKQYRAIGMFGCFDVQLPDGSRPNLKHAPVDQAFAAYKKAYTENGLVGMIRPPNLHVAPPLTITEDELMDGFDRQDRALYALDEALGF